MRQLVRSLALTAGVLLLAAPAYAADQTVTANPNNTFTPKDVTISPGETVTWMNQGGFHNVKFDDGTFEQPADPEATPWTTSHRFDQEGTFRYYCELHGGKGGVGMAGTVVVGSGVAPPDTTAPVISSLKASPSRMCNGPKSVCRKRGTSFKFKLSEAAKLSGVITRKGVRKTISASGKSGSNTIKYSGKGLTPGKYTLTLTATDAAGNKSDPAKTKFTVRRAG